MEGRIRTTGSAATGASKGVAPTFAVAVSAAGLLVLGLAMIAVGTGATSVGRYAAPPEILPGVAVLHLGSLLGAFLVASTQTHLPLLYKLRDHIGASVDATARQACFFLFLLLAVLQCAMSLVDGHAGMPNYARYSVSLAGNIIVSLTGASAFAGWLVSLLVVRRTGVEPVRTHYSPY